MIRQRAADVLAGDVSARVDRLPTIGLTRSQLLESVGRDRLARLSAQFRRRGTPNQLLNIARYGSVIADVACASDDQDRLAILREGAQFNLAVALFDTAFDDFADLRPHMASILNGRRIRERLMDLSCAALRSQEPMLEDLVSLCDSVVLSIGQRLRQYPAHLSFLADLLDRMYASEVDPQADRRDAKTLPIVFLGTLSKPVPQSRKYHLLLALAQWISRMDDWQDIGRDVIACQANQFVYSRDGRSWHWFPYMVRVGRLVLLGESSRDAIANSLTDELRRVLKSAELAGGDTAAKTRVLAMTVFGLP